MMQAMGNTWKEPVFGIMTYDSRTPREHTYGVLFDAADVGSLSHVRLIEYAGLAAPPSAAPTMQPRSADGGILMRITPQAADHMVQQIDTLKAELGGIPKIQRYYHADRIARPTEKPASREDRFAQHLKRITALKAGPQSEPTNCVHFMMQAARRAGVDLAAIDPQLPHADEVETVASCIDKAMQEQANGSFHQASVGASAVLYFQSAGNESLLATLQNIPPDTLAVWRNSPPLMRGHAARLESTTQPPVLSM